MHRARVHPPTRTDRCIVQRRAQKYPTRIIDSTNHSYTPPAQILLALVMHPRLNRFPPSDIAWAMALYLEALAAIPQLFMFQSERKVHRWTAHFLFAQGMAKLITFIFWIGTYMELNVKKHPTRKFMGYWALFVQGCQLMLMADFLIQYVKCVRLGVSLQQAHLAKSIPRLISTSYENSNFRYKSDLLVFSGGRGGQGVKGRGGGVGGGGGEEVGGWRCGGGVRGGGWVTDFPLLHKKLIFWVSCATRLSSWSVSEIMNVV